MRASALLAPVAFIAALTVGTAPAAADTLIVDNDRAECPNADSPSIQAAVAAAQPGDTLRVCPGLYTEDVNVDKPALRLRAHGGDHGARGRCLDEVPPPPDPGGDRRRGGLLLQAGPQRHRARALRGPGLALRDHHGARLLGV